MSKKYKSKFKDQDIVYKTKDAMIFHYEGLAYAAQREGNYILAQEYFQHAEHYKRVKD